QPVPARAVRAAPADPPGAARLPGARATPPAAHHPDPGVVARVAALAASLGDRLESLEINPLRVDGAEVEILDALVTWA
ncbi:CoA-binding protein, partial [Spirillospora sp. NPDC046719]